jgi:uncharacterized membrane protein
MEPEAPKPQRLALGMIRIHLPRLSAAALGARGIGSAVSLVLALSITTAVCWASADRQEQEAANRPPPHRPPPVQFTAVILEDLGTRGCPLFEQAVAINAAGETAGTVCAEGVARAACWSVEGKLTQLAPADAPGDSFAYDINDQGVVVGGTVRGQDRTAFLWSAEHGRVELDLGPGAVPLAIGASGAVAFSLPTRRALVGGIWTEGSGVAAIEGLDGDVLVRAIGPSGSVAGIAGGGSLPARGFLRRGDGTLLELGVADGFLHSHGNGLNDEDAVVGLCRSEKADRAARWTSGGSVKLLPTVRGENVDSAAFAVNHAGWIVGTEAKDEGSQRRSRGILWVADEAYELDALVVEPQHLGPFEIDVAWDVNDRGQIAVRGRVGGEVRALRLDPR